MRFVRNWTRDSKSVTRDLLGSSRTFDSENKRPTRFNLVFKVSRSVENFRDRFRWRKTNKQKTNKSFRAHQKCLFHEIQKKKNRSENFFCSGPVAYSHLLFRHGDLRNNMLWSEAPRKNRKVELIEDSFGLTSNAVSFLCKKTLVRGKRIMDNGKSLQSTVQAVLAALDLGGFVGLKMSLHCLFKYWKQFYNPAPLVAITWGSVKVRNAILPLILPLVASLGLECCSKSFPSAPFLCPPSCVRFSCGVQYKVVLTLPAS